MSADLCFSLNKFPEGDEKISGKSFELRTGGPAANAALTVKLLGGKSELIALTDTSALGNTLIDQLAENNFDTSLIIRESGGLTTAAVLAEHSGSRQVISCKSTLRPCTLPTSVDEFNPSVILFDGHLPQLSQKLIGKFPKAITILDAGSLHEGTELLADKVCWLIASAKYARAKSGEQDLNKAIEKLSSLNSRVIITDGANGSYWQTFDSSGHTPAPKIKAIDSNGAGDVFHGAFAYGLSQELSFEENIVQATEAAALSCSQPGIKHISQ